MFNLPFSVLRWQMYKHRLNNARNKGDSWNQSESDDEGDHKKCEMNR
jgi:hypothetical protein